MISGCLQFPPVHVRHQRLITLQRRVRGSHHVRVRVDPGQLRALGHRIEEHYVTMLHKRTTLLRRQLKESLSLWGRTGNDQ